MVDLEYFNSLYERALKEKERTDIKYGNKEVGGTNKSRLVAIIVENIGTSLSDQRRGDIEAAERHYVNALAHVISLSAHIKNAETGPQYLG
jgi:hypothetical protein